MSPPPLSSSLLSPVPICISSLDGVVNASQVDVASSLAMTPLFSMTMEEFEVPSSQDDPFGGGGGGETTPEEVVQQVQKHVLALK
jgi:hypothetical protein